MDEGSIEPYGKVISKTGIYKAFKVGNIQCHRIRASGEMSNPGEMGVGVNAPEC